MNVYAKSVILLISVILTFISLEIVGLIPPYSGSFYMFTLPYIFQVSIVVILSLISLFIGKNKFITYSCLILFSTLIIPSTYALSIWPAGDDGPGLAWSFAIDGSSYLTTLFGIVLVVFSIKHDLKVK